MRVLKFVLGFIFVFSGVVFFMTTTDFALDYKSKTFGNVKVLFFPDQSLPYISYSVWFSKGGVDFNKKEAAGLSVLTGYLFDQGAGGLSSEEIQKKLNYYGTELSVNVGRSSSEIALQGLSTHSEKLWDLFIKIILEPNFESSELDLLKNQLMETRLKKFDSPSFVAKEVWRKQVFGQHPSGSPQMGTIPSLKSIQLEDVKRFYKENYEDSFFVISVAGQYDKELENKILSVFEKKFSEKNFSDSLPFDFKEDAKESFLLLSNKELVQSQMILGYFFPASLALKPKKSLALSLLNNIFGGSRLDSRLMFRLRENLGLTYGIHSQFSFNKRYGLFLINGATQTETTGQFLKETLNQLHKLKTKGVTEKELSTAKNYLKSRFNREMETVEGQMDMFIYYHFHLGFKESFLEDYISLLESVTLEDINGVIEEFVHPKKLKILIYGHPSVRSQLSEFPNVQETSFKEFFSKELP